MTFLIWASNRARVVKVFESQMIILEQGPTALSTNQKLQFFMLTWDSQPFGFDSQALEYPKVNEHRKSLLFILRMVLWILANKQLMIITWVPANLRSDVELWAPNWLAGIQTMRRYHRIIPHDFRTCTGLVFNVLKQGKSICFDPLYTSSR